MAATSSSSARPKDEVNQIPGTFMLKEGRGLFSSSHNDQWTYFCITVRGDGDTAVVLFPEPTSDPNDPLNWPKWLKVVNFGSASVFVFFTFVLINILYIPYAMLVADLNFAFGDFTKALALCFTGMAIGSVLFLPWLHKLGRRPLYLFSSCIQFAAGVWLSEMHSRGELIAAYFISGLGGGLSETLLQITIVDLYFVHQRATMSALFVLVQTSGSCLGPLAAGYIVMGQDWRWMWRWCAIFLGVNLLLVFFFFEESKYIPALHGEPIREAIPPQQDPKGKSQDTLAPAHDTEEQQQQTTISTATRPAINPLIKRKTYLQRLALFTNTDAPIKHHFYQPFVLLFSFPAVFYAALTYGTLTTWYSTLISITDSIVPYPPYNFSPASVGLLTFSVNVGSIIGAFVGGPICDKSIVWLSGRNKGVFEPEMRLYMALMATIPAVAGILMVGVGLAHELHWAFIAVGFGLFGFAWIVMGDVSIAYVTDCYQDLVGDVLVAVVFARNVCSIAVQFGLSPWLKAVGLQDLTISAAMIALFFMLMPIPLLFWGKKARARTAEKYRRLAHELPSYRAT
ncbi:hypothetical protein A1O1_01659 [Capronia coronata CBS 617.96]|uniref:Major facilitator superfamily (MFS) profile domain-containing protein n=1 Tax=Capronia coronata CBS 617.96 TaxID=1182541 RepID=W9YK37_9EURO|nr:uncharacterized protein A1O1_01659 [Capronia coronata CBS 617.96]EXJ93267.1 hypothetical protein A1O1_01659 [Capronia coronata CBS 617.96]